MRKIIAFAEFKKLLTILQLQIFIGDIFLSINIHGLRNKTSRVVNSINSFTRMKKRKKNARISVDFKIEGNDESETENFNTIWGLVFIGKMSTKKLFKIIEII